jgi:AcrR family transcriptional regulator
VRDAVAGERQTRRRGRVLEEAILDAAWTELAERGWSGFTIDGVAERSGAAKSVIYRRWTGRVDLAHALLARERARASQSVESGADLRTDLLTFLQNTTRFLRGPVGDASRGIAMEGDAGNHVSLFAGEVLVARVGEFVERARDRGEIAGRPSPLVLNAGFAVVMWEFVHTRRPPTDEDLVELVDTVWLPAIRASSA